MTNEMALEALKWIAQTLTERCQEANEECKNENNDFNSGRSLAYQEVMDIMKSRLEVLGVDGDLPSVSSM